MERGREGRGQREKERGRESERARERERERERERKRERERDFIKQLFIKVFCVIPYFPCGSVASGDHMKRLVYLIWLYVSTLYGPHTVIE